MPDTHTVFLPGDWPTSINLDAWALVGSGKATSTSGQTKGWAQRTSADPDRPPDRYQIDIYHSGGQYVIAGTRSDTEGEPDPNIGRIATSRTHVVAAIQTVAGNLSVDATVQGVLVQDVLGSLAPSRPDDPHRSPLQLPGSETSSLSATRDGRLHVRRRAALGMSRDAFRSPAGAGRSAGSSAAGALHMRGLPEPEQLAGGGVWH